MALNFIPKSPKALSTLANQAATGTTKVGASVPVTVTTAAEITSERTAFNTASSQYNAGRNTYRAAYATFHTAEGELADWLGMARTVLAGSFGQRWSAQWAAAGFTNYTTAIPNQIADRIGLTEMLATFLVDNPGYEVDSLNLTAPYALDLWDAATAARDAVMTAEEALSRLDAARQTARTTLVSTLRGLIKNLQAKLQPTDPRWLAFGLQMPATRVTPPKPTGLVVTLNADGSAQLTCDPVIYGNRFRWRMRQVGPGYVFNRVASTTAPLARVATLPPGTTQEFIVQAVNDNLQSVPSDPVPITIPPAVDAPVAEAQRPAASAPAATPALAPKNNGNTKANGNGHTAAAARA